MKRPLVPKQSSVSARAEIANLRIAKFTAEAASPFASLGYKADPCRAYVEFEICHSLPAIAGPVQSGNFVGYFPDTLAASHQSLYHQQFNLRHMLAAYAPKPPPGTKQSSAIRDRIVGCVVATHFPSKPAQGWLSPSNPKGATACIRACAVIFKLAEGMPKLLGEHLTSRVRQSVSIECTTPWDNIGVWAPSRSELQPLLGLSEEFMQAMEITDETGKEYDGLPHFGKLSGEQLIVVYGGGGRPIQFQGVGMMARPAEQTAKIVSLTAERGGGQVAFLAAEEVNGVLAGQTLKFTSTGRMGRVEAVISEGEAKLGGLRLRASVEEPILRIVFDNRDVILKPLSAVADHFS